MRLATLPCFFSCCAGLMAQTITFAEGTPTSLSVVSVSETAPNGAATTIVQDIEILPVEITGRVLGQESDSARSRRLTQNGMVRVELPNGGRLFRYRRNGGAQWGFLHVADDGSARVVLEQPGAFGADPFEDRIGIARNGSHFAVPLLVGGLFVVRLDGNNYSSTGTPHRLIATSIIAEPTAVMVGEQVVWYQSEQLEVFRCGLGDNAVPVNVSSSPQPNAILKDQMAMSGDGSRIVWLYGPQQQQRLWTATTSSGPSVLPPLASKYEDPGYLPEEPGSPALMLNEDGSRLFFIDSEVRDELYLLDTSGALPTLQITEDAIFEPYIGVHILPSFMAGAITVAIGDPNLMDWYRASLDASGGTVVNLTATGSATQPFPEGTIDPSTIAVIGTTQFAVEQGATTLRLRRIDLATGTQSLLYHDVLEAPRRGTGFGETADLIVRTSAGDRLFTNASALPLYALPPGLNLAPSARGPVFSAVWATIAGTNWGAPAYYLPNGQFVTGSLENGLQQLVTTRQNGVVLVGATLRYVSPGVSVVIQRPTVAWRRCLSGAGV